MSIFKSLLLIIDNDVNICSQSKLTLLLFSIYLNRSQIVKEIINNNKNDILFAFVQTYRLSEQIKFLKQIKNYDESDYGYPPSKLMAHASLKSMNLICKFDECHNHSIDFNKLLPDGKSFFTTMNPSLDNSGDVAYFLLKHGVDPDKPYNFGRYPLIYCIAKDLNDAAIVLIRSKKVDLNRRFTLVDRQIDLSDSQNVTYLHLADSRKSSDVLAELLDLNIFDINCKNEYNETPLITDIKNRSLDNIKLLFSKYNLEYENIPNNDIIETAKEAACYTENDDVHPKSKKKII